MLEPQVKDRAEGAKQPAPMQAARRRPDANNVRRVEQVAAHTELHPLQKELWILLSQLESSASETATDMRWIDPYFPHHEIDLL